MNYYNEIDKNAAEWLKNLINAGILPAGDVDTRSIQEVMPDDLSGYTQCHFFAGIGGWPFALQLAGWRTDEPVWTGSCPCQPFSVAGKGRGESDPRHLWPDFCRLIQARKPARVFGEQVASKDGRLWLNGVRTDLEALAYEVGAADLCAAGVSAPHIRQRLYWVADAKHDGQHRPEGIKTVSDSYGQDRGIYCGSAGGMGNAFDQELQGHAGNVDGGNEPGRVGEIENRPATQAGCDCWSNYIIIPCGDGKTRRIKPGLAPMADGLPGRVGQIRAYGNAIVPQLAAEFISAFLATRP